jgi:hypothetical protein
VGQACFGCLTLTLSLSRFAPDLERTMTRPKPRMLNRAGKPKLMRGHGLRFRTSKGSQSSIGRPFLRKVCAIELKWCSLVFPCRNRFNFGDLLEFEKQLLAENSGEIADHSTIVVKNCKSAYWHYSCATLHALHYFFSVALSGKSVV